MMAQTHAALWCRQCIPACLPLPPRLWNLNCGLVLCRFPSEPCGGAEGGDRLATESAFAGAS